ncbi:MAG: glycosyltransferase family 4 protein [Polyangiaceae bacterium]
MAVLLVTERYPPERGGLARASARIAELLRGSGETVHVLRLASGVTPGRRDRQEDGGIVVHRLGRLASDEALFAAWVEHAVDIATSHDVDVIHGIYGHPAGFVARVAGAYAGLPSIVSLRGNDFDRGVFRPTAPQLAQAIEGATVVTAVTRVMARRAEALFGRSVDFVPNAVDTEAFHRVTPDNSLRASLGLGESAVIGFSGELREKKGSASCPRLRGPARLRDVRLLLVGGLRADAEAAWDAFARAEPEAAQAVHRLRYDDSPERLAARLALCDVMVFPSLFEGMPNAVLEAMACECAILASDVGGHPELLDHGVSGALLSLRDLDRLPEAIGEMLDLAPEERRAFGEAARARVLDGHRPEDERAAWQAIYAQIRR